MSKFQEWKKRQASGDVKPWDLLNPAQPKVDDTTESLRMSHCTSCPEFIGATKQCKQCGCIMPMKVKLKEATCPLGKW